MRKAVCPLSLNPCSHVPPFCTACVRCCTWMFRIKGLRTMLSDGRRNRSRSHVVSSSLFSFILRTVSSLVVSTCVAHPMVSISSLDLFDRLTLSLLLFHSLSAPLTLFAFITPHLHSCWSCACLIPLRCLPTIFAPHLCACF